MSEQPSPDSIDVEVPADDAPEKCQKCGIAMNRFNRDRSKPVCVSCSLGSAEAMKMLKAFSAFEKMPATSPEMLGTYGIGSSAGRILIGAMILFGMTYGASLVFRKQTGMGAWVGWVIGVLVVSAVVFRNANPIDLVRWRRFWRGHLVGFVIATFLGLFTFMADATGSYVSAHTEAMMPILELQLYGFATLAGLLTGFLWLAIKNTDDRDEIVVLFRDWERRRSL